MVFLLFFKLTYKHLEILSILRWDKNNIQLSKYLRDYYTGNTEMAKMGSCPEDIDN